MDRGSARSMAKTRRAGASFSRALIMSGVTLPLLLWLPAISSSNLAQAVGNY